jgi:hypothetical protein
LHYRFGGLLRNKFWRAFFAKKNWRAFLQKKLAGFFAKKIGGLFGTVLQTLKKNSVYFYTVPSTMFEMKMCCYKKMHKNSGTVCNWLIQSFESRIKQISLLKKF